MNSTFFSCRAIVVIPIVLMACTSHRNEPTTYHDPNMDFGLIRSVAVLPFENLSQNPKAGETVRDVLVTLLQASIDLYVVPTGEVQRALSRIDVGIPELPTEDEAVNLAKNLEVDVLITGTVLEYGQLRSASAEANVITVSAKMMEGQSGKVIWRQSMIRR